MTRILQEAGSIAVKAQKREVEHFQIETPYLAAIVKGTEFVVTLEPGAADVQVIKGEVEVADFKSGEVASIKPGQAARSQGDAGLILRGTGIFDLIRKPASLVVHCQISRTRHSISIEQCITRPPQPFCWHHGDLVQRCTHLHALCLSFKKGGNQLADRRQAFSQRKIRPGH